MQNIELKVQCTIQLPLQEIEQLARITGAIYAGTLRQTDTYFITNSGRLKLREWDLLEAGTSSQVGSQAEQDQRGATLIGYHRPDQTGSRLSKYILSPVNEPANLKAALELTLGLRVIVEKVRKLYMYNYTRIHLDHVTGLGDFVELETVLGPKVSSEEGKREHVTVIQQLRLDELPVFGGSYSDLLQKA